jgi:hypothetical protein
MIQAKFGLNWPSGFRGEDFWKSLQTDDRRQVMAIAHMTLWVRWANKNGAMGKGTQSCMVLQEMLTESFNQQGRSWE